MALSPSARNAARELHRKTQRALARLACCTALLLAILSAAQGVEDYWISGKSVSWPHVALERRPPPLMQGARNRVTKLRYQYRVEGRAYRGEWVEPHVSEFGWYPYFSLGAVHAGEVDHYQRVWFNPRSPEQHTLSPGRFPRYSRTYFHLATLLLLLALLFWFLAPAGRAVRESGKESG